MSDQLFNPENAPTELEPSSTGQALAAIRREREARASMKPVWASVVLGDVEPVVQAETGPATAGEGWIAVAARHDGWLLEACLERLQAAQIESRISAREVQVRQNTYDCARELLKASRATLWKRRDASNQIVDGVFGAILGLFLAGSVAAFVSRGSDFKTYTVAFTIGALLLAPAGAMLLTLIRRQ